MDFEFDPFNPYGLSPKPKEEDLPKAFVQQSYNKNLFYTKDEVNALLGNAGESLWEVNSYGTQDFLQPKDPSQGLVTGANIHSSVTSAFNGISAIFNGSPSLPSQGINYFANFSYGVGFTGFGGIVLGGRARGTEDTPTQTLSGDYLGGVAFTSYDGSQWVTSGNSHLLPGFWVQNATDSSGGSQELNMWLGGILTPMIGFETDTNNIILNQAQLDADTIIRWDNGDALTVTGSTGQVDIPDLFASGDIELGHATDTTLSRSSAGVLAVEGVVIPSISSTNTLTNKRVTPRVDTTTSSATPTINTDNVDIYGLTAQTADITSFTTNLSGTPTNGQKLWIYVVGTAARAITWGSSFENGASTLPTTTVGTERLDVGFVWNAVSSKWRCVAAGSS